MTWEVIVYLAAKAITRTDFHLVQPIQHVDFSQGDSSDTADRTALTYKHRIEPTHTALAPGNGAELVTTLPDALANFVFQLGRKRPTTYASGISLDDTEHITGRIGPEAATRCRSAADSI